MCGIAGFVSGGRLREDSPEVIRRMTRSLVHRGPDGEGFFESDGVALGHRRLAIIDLAGGHQPFVSEDGQTALVFNGEIYNYIELRDELEKSGIVFQTASDTEVLLRGWECWGESVLKRLNGMFAFGIWEGRARRLTLARDRMGQKPLYYSASQNGLIFGSELKAMLAHPEIDRGISPDSLARYMLYDHVPTPHSMVRAVQRLPAGGFLRWTADEGVETGQYWDLEFSGEVPRTLEEASEILWERLKHATRLRLRSDVPVGIFLSGGLDSSAVLAAVAAERSPEEIRTFAIGFDDPSFDESSHARRVADHFGTQHLERTLTASTMLEELPGILTALDEPMADASIVPTHLLSGFAREHVKVALGGDGGDELFLGYPTFQAHRMAGWIDWVPRFLISGVMEPLASLLPVSTSNLSLDYRIRRFLRGLRHGPIERHFAWIGGMDPLAQAGLFTEAWAEGIDFSNLFSDVHGHLSAVTGRDAYDRLSYVYSKLYMGDDILVKVDRASMAHSLEVRSPLLDPGVVSLATALPTRFKMQGMEMKRVLKHMLKSRLPPGIVERPKKGFGVPIAEWLKGPLRPLMEDLLGSDRIRREGIFRPEAVQALVRDHLQGRADHRKPLWSLIVFQLWREHHAPDSFLSV